MCRGGKRDAVRDARRRAGGNGLEGEGGRMEMRAQFLVVVELCRHRGAMIVRLDRLGRGDLALLVMELLAIGMC